ncbi:PH domain-containing protein [Nocardioides sp. S-58]|uniref:PH domain-containing protein n=1 Tax=Nocardioides renjunii TaxID=3095075 RepID=A0ABU5K8C2_9ACTN|nr:PH domain-containing protein [Nocardioides sp. S-58]MDZ5661227.1 PH domain-containing protein [Nocardioides sp. S-58]
MIDFQNGTFVKLGPIDPQGLAHELEPLLVAGEQVLLAFKGMRDSVVFTDKRLISINVQGLTGKKRDYTSLPLNRVQAWRRQAHSTWIPSWTCGSAASGGCAWSSRAT